MRITEQIKATLIQDLRDKLRIQDPAIEVDPAYKFTNANLWTVIEESVVKFDVNQIITTLDAKYVPTVLIIARKEILWRLALSTAPFYRIEAEGASLEKNMRFDHYYKLVIQAQYEYISAMDALGGVAVVEVQDVTTSRRHNSIYNFEHSTAPVVELTLSGITSNSVNLDWTKFDAPNGKFYAYKLYIKTTPVADPYADSYENIVPVDADYVEYNIHKLTHRFSNLLPNTTYHVCVVSKDFNGIFGYVESSFTTLPAS